MTCTTRIRTSALAAVGAGAILFALAGCAAVDDLAYGRSSSSAATASEFQDTRDAPIDWLPSDATDIRAVSSTRADAESVEFSSASGPGGCTETARVSAPTMDVADAPDVYAVSTVLVCGAWAVAHADGVYYGWTPATEADVQR